MADWWYAKNGERQGPVSSAQLRQLAQSGELLPNDMVFKDGASQWIVASSVNNLFPSGGGEPVRTERIARDERDAGGLEFDERADDDDRTVRRKSKGSSGGLMDLLMFRRMIAPIIIIILFWLGVAGVLFAGLGMFISGVMAGGMAIVGALLGALIAVPMGILTVRLYSELVILLFRMNETLTDIKNLLEKERRSKS
jgi:hypothetical protein